MRNTTSNKNMNFSTIAREPKSRSRLEMFFPGNKFPSISLSGSSCALDCAHCGGHYLEHMKNVDSPSKLFELCLSLNKKKVKGVLISGGCNQQGHIMLDDYTKVIADIKIKTNLMVNVHTGLVTKNQAKKIADTNVDSVSFDLVGETETIRDVYGLKHSTEDYQRSLLFLKDAGVKRIIPHICIGLHFGKIKGEYNAIDIASKIKPPTLVFIVIIPTKGTRMAEIEPPKIDEIIEIINYARSSMENVKLFLGCMRPRLYKFRVYNTELEQAAIRAGIDGLVLPSKTTCQWLKEHEIKTHINNICCAMI